MKAIRTVSGNILSLFDSSELILSIEEIISENDPNTIIMLLSGKFISETDHDFYDEMMAFVSIGKNIILDCSKVIYMAASCMRSILSVQQSMDNQRQGTLTIRNLPEAIYNEFKSTGLTELLNVE